MIAMANVRMYLFLLFLYAYILCSATTVTGIETENSERLDSKTYFDVLNDFKTKVKLSRNIKQYDFHEFSAFNLLFHDIEGHVLQNMDQHEFHDPNQNELLRQSRLRRMLRGLDEVVKNGTVSSTCANDTGMLITSLFSGQHWAIPFFDATGKPGPSITQGRLNFVGNMNQCRAAAAPGLPGVGTAGYKGNYCVIGLQSPSLPIGLQLGACLPDTCSDVEITSLVKEIVLAANASFHAVTVKCLTGETEVTSATVVAIVIICVIGFMMIIGTVFDIVYVQMPLWHTESSGTYYCDQSQEKTIRSNHLVIPGNNAQELNDKETAPLLVTSESKPSDTRKSPPSSSVLTKVLLAFSVYTNSKKTLNVSQASGSIGSIHGIRFLSMSWVVLAHTFFFSTSYSSNYLSEFPIFLRRWTFDVIANGFVSVDTFFTLSGLLTSYLTIREMLRKGWKLNWAMFYFHRFWRLTPPYMFSLVIYLGLQQYTIKGPLRSNVQPVDKPMCEQNWWTNLLYINNIVNSENICFGHSWYLANDMQFFILSPLMLIPFHFHRLAGLFSCLLFLLITWTTTGVLSSVDKMPTTVLTLNTAPDKDGIAAWQYDYYAKPWCRIGPFVVGILAGYILAINKGKPFYMKRWVVALGWTMAVFSALAVVYGLRGDIYGDQPSSLGVSAFYNAFSRSVWGACVCWVIVACTAGYGGPVNTLLSWSPFVVLGRLTYMTYLIHIPIIYIVYENLDQPFHINDTTIVVYFIGILVLSNMMAFVFMLGLESPMIGLEKALLRR